jgi:hypothetical protein
MNYFAHARPFLDDPYLAAGTGVPDWLVVADRSVRVRLKHAGPWAHDPDPRMAAVARGVAQHIRNDLVFHRTRAFAELSMDLAARIRGLLGPEAGFRPAFLGHLLVELLLDATLIAEDAARLETYYRVLDGIDPGFVQEAVNRMAPRPTVRLGMMISEFRRLRILWDYLEDAKLLGRLNQVMRRVGMAQLPERLCEILPDARRDVAGRKEQLLEGTPAPPEP